MQCNIINGVLLFASHWVTLFGDIVSWASYCIASLKVLYIYFTYLFVWYYIVP